MAFPTTISAISLNSIGFVRIPFKELRLLCKYIHFRTIIAQRCIANVFILLYSDICILTLACNPDTDTRDG